VPDGAERRPHEVVVLRAHDDVVAVAVACNVRAVDGDGEAYVSEEREAVERDQDPVEALPIEELEGACPRFVRPGRGLTAAGVTGRSPPGDRRLDSP